MNPVTRRASIMAALPGTPPQISAKAGCSQCTVRVWLRLALEERTAHIGSWQRTQGRPLPVYEAGPGNDAKRPTARGNAAWVRLYKRRARREIAKQAIERKAALQAVVIPSRPQSIFAALGL